MNELSKRLKENYLEEIREYLEFLKSKGFVLIAEYGTTNLRVNQYNAERDKFSPKYQMYEFPSIILNDLPNYYNLDVNNDIVNLTREVLPELNHDELRDYLSYIKAGAKVTDSKDLKAEFKQLKKMSKEMSKDLDKSMYEVAYTQAQALAKEFIIYNDSRNSKKGYYQFNKDSNKFKKISDRDIADILQKCFNHNFNSFSILPNIKNVYMNHIVISDLPIRWNQHFSSLDIMKANQKNYEKVKKVTDKFM